MEEITDGDLEKIGLSRPILKDGTAGNLEVCDPKSIVDPNKLDDFSNELNKEEE